MTQRAFPKRVIVKELISSRYPGNHRPQSWDGRVAGTDVVRAADGSVINLKSDGMQSPPQPGWTIMLTGGAATEGYRWTLYGIPRN